MRIALLAAIACVATASLAAEPALQPVAFNTWARVTLDSGGQPLSIEPNPELPEPVREFLRTRVAPAQGLQPLAMDSPVKVEARS